MTDEVTVTVLLNTQQLELLERLIRLERLADTPGEVLRQVLRLYAADHPEIIDPAGGRLGGS